METYALFKAGNASRLIFDSFDTSPQDDPVRLVFPDIEDLQVRNSARNGCLAAYRLLNDLGYLHRTDRFFYSCQFFPPNLNLQVQGSSAGLAFCLKFVQEFYRQHTGTPLPYSVAATGAISDATRSATVEPVNEINAKVEAALNHLAAGDLVVYPAGNQLELDARLQERAAQSGIRLVPVSCVAQAVEALLARKEPQRHQRRLVRAVVGGVVLACLSGGLGYFLYSSQPSHTPDTFAPQGEGYPKVSAPPPQADLASRLQGGQGLALAVDFHYLGPNKKGERPLDVPAAGSVTLRYGDMFKLACRANQQCYLHIYLIDQQGRVDRLPDPMAEASPPLLQADTTYYFPSALADWRQVDTVEGSETLYLFAASTPDRELEELYRRYRQVPEEKKREYRRQLRAVLQTRMAQQTREVFSTSFAFTHAPTDPSAKAPQGPDLQLRGDESGQILFTSERYGDTDIYKMNLDGNGQNNLTDHHGPDSTPSWSPDGTQIAFTSYRDGNGEVYLMNANGSAVQNLTHHPGRDTNPSWSPDGNQIAFQSNRDNVDSENYDVYLMNTDGSQVRPLATSSYREQQPAWSPDGQWIAYLRSTTFDDQQIYLMKPDGSDKHPFQPSMLPLNAVSPSWSPDGKHLAFTGMVPGIPTSLFVVALATGTLTPIALPTHGFSPSYAPDGTHLVFAATPPQQETHNVCIYFCDIRGQRLQLLTNTRQTDSGPTWSEGFRCLGTAAVGEWVERILYVDNPGNDTLQVNQVRFSDPQFAAEPEQFVLAPGEVQRVALRFAPAQEGTRYATLTFLSDDPDDPEIRLILNGRGRPAIQDQSQTTEGVDVRVSAHSGI